MNSKTFQALAGLAADQGAVIDAYLQYQEGDDFNCTGVVVLAQDHRPGGYRTTRFVARCHGDATREWDLREGDFTVDFFDGHHAISRARAYELFASRATDERAKALENELIDAATA